MYQAQNYSQDTSRTIVQDMPQRHNASAAKGGTELKAKGKTKQNLWKSATSLNKRYSY